MAGTESGILKVDKIRDKTLKAIINNTFLDTMYYIHTFL
jgi:hypothetical protein